MVMREKTYEERKAYLTALRPYRVAPYEVMALDKERQSLDTITECLEKLLLSIFCKDIR